MNHIAVVGAGKWGRNIIKTLAKLGALAAIVEIDQERGQALAMEYGVRYFTSLGEVLKTDIAAVAIATPVFSHYHLAKQALLAKRDVFVEKPMTVEASEADELIALAEKNQCILMVGHLLLYQPAIAWIKSCLAENYIGKPYAFYQVRRSLGTIRTEENVLFSLGVHDLAVLTFLIGARPQSLQACSQSIISKKIADKMTLHLQYPNGLQAEINLNWLWPFKERYLMILGERGALKFDELSQQVIYYQNYGNPDATLTSKGEEVVFSTQAEPLTLELAHFLECIALRTQPISDGRQGREVISLLRAIEKIREDDGTTLLCS